MGNRVEGSVLEELGLDRQAALELKLKAALHQGIPQLVRRKSKNKIKVKGVGQECPTHTGAAPPRIQNFHKISTDLFFLMFT
jgi:hypothetical protein